MSKYTYELYIDAGNEWRYRLIAENGNNVGSSGEGYKNFGDVFALVNKIKSADSDIKIIKEGNDTKQLLQE